MECPRCGTAIPDGANFCRVCGLATRTATSDLEATSAMPQAERPSTGGPHVDDDPTDPGLEPGVVLTSTSPGGAGDGQEAPGPTGLVTCPNCGAPNSSRRALCGRCGVDLVTGVAAAQPLPRAVPASPADVTPSEPRDRAPQSHTGWIVVAAGIVIGGLIGALVATGVGPFGGGAGQGLPEAEFDPSAYPGDPVALPLEAISTSTTRPSVADGQRYEASLMVDGDLATAWNNSGDTNPDGVNEIIRLDLAEPAWVSELVVGNGSQGEDDSFQANARLERARVTLDGDVEFLVTFLDRQGLQLVRFDEPQLTTTLELEVLEVFEGDTYEDLAIAELIPHGFTAVDEDRDVARERAPG